MEKHISLITYRINGIEFKFKEGSHIRFRMTDLRSATKDYFKFCQEVKF